MNNSTNINKTLQDRQKTHGSYKEHAKVTQDILAVMMAARNWNILRPTQKESLHMIAHKAARVLVGDPNVPDHWHDKCGYAKLCEDELLEELEVAKSKFPEYNGRSHTPEDGGHYERQSVCSENGIHLQGSRIVIE